MEKKNLFLWSLYDFANSIVYISFLLYFAQWLVIDGGLSDFWYNALFAIATLFLFFSAPLLAARVDARGGGKFYLNFSTIGTCIGYGAAIGFAYLGVEYVIPAAAAFIVGQYFYQLSFVFYTPMLVQLSDERGRPLASGIGQFANSLGQIVGVLVALPLAYSHTAPLAPSLLLFFVLALPMMLFFKERKIPHEVISTNQGFFFKKLIRFLAVSAAAPLLLAYFFFNDAIITLSNNYAIVLERVFGTPDTYKSMLLLAILIMSAIGGVVAGIVGKRAGARTTLLGILVCWIVLLPSLAFAPTFSLFATLTIPVGLLIGSAYAMSRVYMTELLAPHELTYGFSFYTLFERFASIVGPLSWGTTLGLLGSSSGGYRAAIFLMAILIATGLCILLWWGSTNRSRFSTT